MYYGSVLGKRTKNFMSLPHPPHTPSTVLGTSQVLGQGFPTLLAREYASKFRITAITVMFSELQVTKSARSQLQSNPRHLSN